LLQPRLYCPADEVRKENFHLDVFPELVQDLPVGPVDLLGGDPELVHESVDGANVLSLSFSWTLLVRIDAGWLCMVSSLCAENVMGSS
jgi:hypothetical protein